MRANSASHPNRPYPIPKLYEIQVRGRASAEGSEEATETAQYESYIRVSSRPTNGLIEWAHFIFGDTRGAKWVPDNDDTLSAVLVAAECTGSTKVA